MSLADISRIDRSIEIAAPPERVWQALTTADELSAWFQMIIEGEIAAGQEIWMTCLHPGYEGKRFSVRILELTPPTRFAWQWHPGAADTSEDISHEPPTTVTFTLEPFAGGTRVSVAETGFDAISLERRAKVYEDNSQGWPTVLGWLANHVKASS